MGEVWKPVTEYNGYYEVSDLGRVRTVDRQVPHKRHGFIQLKSQIIKPTPCLKNGKLVALYVGLWRESKRRNRQVHSLVLEAFVGSCPSGLECCHNDGDPSNNQLENLRWDTHKSNGEDMVKHGSQNCKRVRRGDGVEFDSVTLAAASVNTSTSNISMACQGKSKSCKNFQWSYV